MKAFLVLCLAFVVCITSVPQSVPYELYVRNGGLPLSIGKGYNPGSTYIPIDSEVTAGEVPWMASLSKTSHFCGGSIISSRTILTAAHCVDGLSASALKVRVGSLRHASGGTQLSVSRIVKHASYSASTIDYDIALVITSNDIPIDGINVKTVALASSEPAANAAVMVAGWGTLSGPLPATLRKITINVFSRSYCENAYGVTSFTARMICAGVPEGGKDWCQGNSGGPLTANGVLVGVTSWGRGCALASYPTVYTNVANLYSWINANKQ